MSALSQKQIDVDTTDVSQNEPQVSAITSLENDIDSTNNELPYQALIQNISIGIVKQDKEGRIIVANNAALNMLGLTKDQMMGITSIDPSWNVIHEDGSDFPGHTHPTYIAMTTYQSVHNVVMGVFRPATNDRVWIMVNAEPQFDESGIFEYAYCTFTDISEYKKVQDELHVKNKILNSIDEFALDIVSVIDEHGKHIYVSKSATTISGYSNQELMQINAIDLVPEKNKLQMKAVLDTVSAEGQLKNVLGKFVCKDGSIKYISWSFQWDATASLIYVNGRDKTLEVLKAKEVEAMRVANELQTKEAIFEDEEQKRNSVSYELHENVGQVIATLKLYLEQYEKNGSKEILQASKELLSVCINELRAITYINSTPDFNAVGFTNAIEILMQLQFKKQDIVHALQMAIDDATINDHNRINIYRLMQLWLGHIVTKEGLISVLVSITDDDSYLSIQIVHEVSVAIKHTDYLSQDLLPVKERLNVIGGIMRLDPSDDNKCFTITFLLKK